MHSGVDTDCPVRVQAKSGVAPRTIALEPELRVVGHASSSVTLSLRTSVADKARERRTGRSQFKRAERSPRRLCGGPPGANVPVRLGVALLGKGAAIPCEPRLDSHQHIDSERYRTVRVAHWLLRAIVQPA